MNFSVIEESKKFFLEIDLMNLWFLSCFHNKFIILFRNCSHCGSEVSGPLLFVCDEIINSGFMLWDNLNPFDNFKIINDKITEEGRFLIYGRII